MQRRDGYIKITLLCPTVFIMEELITFYKIDYIDIK